MKILLASKYFLHPSLNGASQLTRRMATALVQAGHEVRAICIGHNAEGLTKRDSKNPVWRTVQDGIPLSVFPPASPPFSDGRPLAEFRFDPGRLSWFEETLDEWRPDVLHVTACSDLPDLLRCAIECGIPTVATLLDFSLICPQQFLLHGKGNLCEGHPTPRKCRPCLKFGTSAFSRLACFVASAPLGPPLLRTFLGHTRTATFDFHRAIAAAIEAQDWLRSKISRFVAPAPAARRLFEAHGIEPHRIIDLVYSLPPEKLQPSPRESNPSDYARGLRIGFVGRPSREKGFQIALEAFMRMNRSAPHAPQLWIAGNGVTQAKIAEYSSNPSRSLELIKQGLIRLFNGLTERELRDTMARLDLCLIPSICYECTPLVLLEALAQGTPCIGSDTDGISHMIADRENGRLFPPGDVMALVKILNEVADDPTCLQKWREHLPVVQDDATYVGRLTEIYHEVVSL
jgi:glycosyltransferase involved in cell wall biosynthesis